MYRTKIEHPQAGASCAWVPSPSGAVIHAIHYRKCNVTKRQEELARLAIPSLDDLLTIALATDTNWTAEQNAVNLKTTAKAS